MYTHTTRAQHIRTGSRTALFEGGPYGSGVSFFWVDAEPGQGPPLHRHPYSETWAVISGTVLVTADGDELEASAGDILVVGPHTPHKFRAAGTERLHMLCIHDSPTVIQEVLDEG